VPTQYNNKNNVFACRHNGSLFQTHKHTTMSSTTARPTKRTKLNNTPELPAEVFRHIMSYVVDAKAFHKKKMRVIRFQIIAMNLYNPVKNFYSIDGQGHYDNDDAAHPTLPALLQTAMGGENDGSWDFDTLDIRFQTTWETRKTIEWLREAEEHYGKWGFHQPIKTIKL